jgi:hypothetical protein
MQMEALYSSENNNHHHIEDIVLVKGEFVKQHTMKTWEWRYGSALPLVTSAPDGDVVSFTPQQLFLRTKTSGTN